jgi:biopolymer transport protein ExbD
MPKVKTKRSSTFIDMTAMTDVAFLLLTFFILTSNFIAKEPVTVNTPSSISEIKIPEINVMQVLIAPDGRIFFGVDGQQNRLELLNKVAEMYKIDFTEKEKKTFSVINSFGVPVEKLKGYLNLKEDVRDLEQNNPGIPIDSLNNQFKVWVQTARLVNPANRLAIKGDKATSYAVIKKVMDALQEIKESRYNLLTSLESEADFKP